VPANEAVDRAWIVCGREVQRRREASLATIGVGHRLGCQDWRLFTVQQRDRVRERLLELASADPRVVAGAAVGGTVSGASDRWSDLDLAFGVADGSPVAEVLDDWSRTVASEFEGVHLFDFPHGSALYRVFLLPGCLQVDLSFAPASDFGATGPRFELLFGSAVETAWDPAPSAREIFGLAVHHAVRARYSIERGRRWQAELWISAARDLALELACLRRGLDATYGRELDKLPGSVLASFEEALVGSLDREALMRALAGTVRVLLRESAQVADAAAKVEPELRELLQED
jgi:hypothetical protein